MRADSVGARARLIEARLTAGMAVSVALFAVTALLTATGRLSTLDAAILQAFHGPEGLHAAARPAWFKEAVRDMTALGSTVVLTFAVVFAAVLLVASGKGGLAGLLILSAALAALSSSLLKIATGRARPTLIEHEVVTYTLSFPSGHALLTAAVLLPVAAVLARAARNRASKRVILGGAALVALAVGLSRIDLGVHWPSDVFAGWCLGVAWACGTMLLARRLRTRGRSHPPGPGV